MTRDCSPILLYLKHVGKDPASSPANTELTPPFKNADEHYVCLPLAVVRDLFKDIKRKISIACPLETFELPPPLLH